MRFKKFAAVVAATGALTFVAACSDDTSSDATSSDSSSQTDAGSSALPEGFPTDVPVVGSEYKPYDAPASNAVGMEVVGATATSFDEAVQKLKDAGYTEESAPSGDPSMRTATYTNAKHIVGVVGVEVGGEYRVTYNVAPAS
ncbi:hypothetical protein [Gordonia sp. (in: high G+C Gram-positive bacteria)]|uniref:hypothetical protein n=1 Tax=Gordonia sp. (in: high G+C Gram-positive bacteria) TaxID=84139 RepID=UPI003F9A067E